MIFRTLIVGVDKLASKAQIIESLNSPILLKALNTLSKCSVAMLKVRYQGGNVTKQRRIHDNPKNVWNPRGLGPTNLGVKLSTFLIYPMEVA
jgi:hypothetical protein